MNEKKREEQRFTGRNIKQTNVGGMIGLNKPKRIGKRGKQKNTIQLGQTPGD